MIANYHSHTWRCKHASGTEREYIEAAIAGGIKIMGFSDHTPIPYDHGYISPNRMLLSQMDDYVSTVLALKNEYKNDIEIHLGLEVEYYPKYFLRLIEDLKPYPVEYFLLGQHYLGNELHDYCSFEPTSDPYILSRYVSQTVEALQTGRFTYFAHPDLIDFRGDAHIYETEMRILCRKAMELDIPLEINLQGVWDHRIYPQSRFWKIAGEVGNKAVIGADAHRTDKVWIPDAVNKAEEIAKTYHLQLLQTIPFRNPLF